MEALGVLLIPLGIAYLAAPIAAFFMALNNRKTVNQLFARLADLEQKLAAGVAAPRTTPLARDIQSAPVPPPPAPAPSQPEIPVAARAPSEAQAVIGEKTAEPPPPPPPPTPVAPQESFEQRIGTRWVVWVGGVALALGGIFLVSFAVDQGYVGPKVRLALAALLAGALVAAGEWARRSEKISGFIGLPSAHVPSILTAAGTMIAFATVYAAYALYEFIGPAAAFVLLGAVAIATLAAALLHGPALAALGLVGAEVVPLMVSSVEPNYWALYIYLAVVTAAALLLARIRLWRWLALTAVVAGGLWTLPGIDLTQLDVLIPHTFHIAVGFALVAALIVSGFMYGPDAESGQIDPVSSGALAVYLLAAGLFVAATDHHHLALALFVAASVAAVAIAWRADAAVGAVPAAAALAILVMVSFALEREIQHLVAPGGVTAGLPPEPSQTDITLHMILGAIFAALFGSAGILAQGRSNHARIPVLWAVAGVAAPIAVVAALYFRIAGFERSIPFAGIMLLLAALFAVAVENLTKRTPPQPGGASAQAIYATGAIAALALTFTMALDRGWLTIALALMVPGIAYVERERPLPALRWLAAAIVMIVIARIGYEPRIVGRDVGTTPIFNWLLYGYGVPALSFWFAGYLLRKRDDDVPARVVDSAAILFSVLLVVLEIRHYITNGNIYAVSSSVTEVALQVCAGLAAAIGLEHVRRRSGSIVHNIGAIVVAVLTLAAIVFGLLIAVNPLLTPHMIGPPFINLALLGYGIPAVLAIILALVARTTRPMPYRAVAAGTAVVLSLMYLTVQIARLFKGPTLSGPTSDAQQYTYSATWLVFGVILLVVGLLLPSKPARIASGAVIMLTVLKVFLFDMAGLTGIWRALSFIGLGLVLMGIGYLYQRLLFPARPGSNVPPAEAAA
jgi:uncharacterized membrane protein